MPLLQYSSLKTEHFHLLEVHLKNVPEYTENIISAAGGRGGSVQLFTTVGSRDEPVIIWAGKKETEQRKKQVSLICDFYFSSSEQNLSIFNDALYYMLIVEQKLEQKVSYFTTESVKPP